MVSAGLRNVSGVRISRGNEAVQIWGSRIVKDLFRRTRVAIWLHEVVVLHVYDKDVLDALGYRCLCSQNASDCIGSRKKRKQARYGHHSPLLSLWENPIAQTVTGL